VTSIRARFSSIPRRGREVGQTRLDPRRRLGADPRDRGERACRSGLAQLRERPDPEGVAQLAHPLRRQAEQPRDADELREGLRLQLAQLRELPGLDELA
jgi:hypothetical protein